MTRTMRERAHYYAGRIAAGLALAARSITGQVPAAPSTPVNGAAPREQRGSPPESQVRGAYSRRMIGIPSIAGATLAGLLALHPTSARAGEETDPVTITPTYNALQAGRVTDGSSRFRLYTGLELKAKDFVLGHSGLTEGNQDFLYGEEKLTAGHAKFPVRALGLVRLGGTVSDPDVIERAYGIRVDAAGLPGVHYGALDIVKHDRVGSEGYGGHEAILFLGRELGEWVLETYHSVKEGGQTYNELEVLAPGKEIKHALIRPFGRAEYNGSSAAVVGVQVQAR